MNVINAKSRSEWEYLIHEWVHSELDRKMLARYLLDDLTLEKIAEEVDLSVVQCQKRVALAKKQLLEHI
jgi:DNA-directed RNA polymerase specialized sigma24 family protein